MSDPGVQMLLAELRTWHPDVVDAALRELGWVRAVPVSDTPPEPLKPRSHVRVVCLEHAGRHELVADCRGAVYAPAEEAGLSSPEEPRTEDDHR